MLICEFEYPELWYEGNFESVGIVWNGGIEEGWEGGGGRGGVERGSPVGCKNLRCDGGGRVKDEEGNGVPVELLW